MHETIPQESTTMSDEHREQAQRIIEREAGAPFDCPSIEAEFRDSHNLERLTNNIALALSSRDAEVKQVLEGLVTQFDHAAWKGFNQGESEFEKGYKHAMAVAARVVRESALYSSS